jgi:hypothetical protein
VLVATWSVKGGVGCSVVSAALALTWARAGHDALLVDLGGDLPAVLGVPEPEGAGLEEWLAAGTDVPADALARVEIPVARGLGLVPRGVGGGSDGSRLRVLAGLCASTPRPIVVDVGMVCADSPSVGFLTEARHSLLVTRPCYLALRRLSVSSLRPSGVVLVSEPGRALDRSDVEEVAGAPVVADLMLDPAVARAVDAGLLATRMPRVLERALRPVVQ